MWETLKSRLGLGKKLTIAEILDANRPRKEQAIARPQEPSFHALKRMHDYNVSQFTVFADDRPIGTVHRDQILNLALQGQDLRKLSVGDAMSETFPESTATARRLAQVFGPEQVPSTGIDESDADFAASLAEALEPGLAEGRSLDDILAENFAPLDAATAETPECLKPQEVLARINSEALPPNRLEHLRSCSWCSSLIASARPVDEEFRAVLGRIQRDTSVPISAEQTGAGREVRTAVASRAAAAGAAGSSSSASVAVPRTTSLAWLSKSVFLVSAALLALVTLVIPFFLRPAPWFGPASRVAGILAALLVLTALRLLAARGQLPEWGGARVLKQTAPAAVLFAVFLLVQGAVTLYLSTKLKSEVASLSPPLTTLSMAGNPKIPLPEGDQKLPSSVLSYANALRRQDRGTALNAAALLAGNEENYDKGIQLVTWAIGTKSQDPQFFNTRGVLYYQKSRYEDAFRDFETAKSLLDSSSEESPSFRGMVLGNTALAARNLGLLDNAKENFYSSFEAFPQRSAEKLHYLVGLGQLLLDTGHAHEADTKLADALQLAQSLHDESGEADVRRSMAEVSHFLGHTSDAVAQVNLALKGHHTDVQKAIDLGVLARFEFDLGVPSEALKHAEQSLSLSRAASYKKGIGDELHLRAQIAGRLDDAKADCDEALSIFTSLGYSRGQAEVYRTLGLLEHEAAMQKLKPNETFDELRELRPDFEASRDYYEKALRLFQESGFTQGTVLAYGGIGSALAFISPDKPEEAIHSFQQALSIADNIQYPLGRANQLGNLGIMYKRQGKLDLAETSLQEALNIHHSIGFKLGEGKQLMNLADVARLRGTSHCREARDRLAQSISIFRDIGAADLLKRATDASQSIDETCSAVSNNTHAQTQRH